MEEQLEIIVEGEVFGGELEDFILSLLDERSCNDGHEDGIDTFVHIFDQS